MALLCERLWALNLCAIQPPHGQLPVMGGWVEMQLSTAGVCVFFFFPLSFGGLCFLHAPPCLLFPSVSCNDCSRHLHLPAEDYAPAAGSHGPATGNYNAG